METTQVNIRDKQTNGQTDKNVKLQEHKNFYIENVIIDFYSSTQSRAGFDLSVSFQYSFLTASIRHSPCILFRLHDDRRQTDRQTDFVIGRGLINKKVI